MVRRRRRRRLKRKRRTRRSLALALLAIVLALALKLFWPAGEAHVYAGPPRAGDWLTRLSTHNLVNPGFALGYSELRAAPLWVAYTARPHALEERVETRASLEHWPAIREAGRQARYGERWEGRACPWR